MYSGHKATDEIPIDYEKLDIAEACISDEYMSARKAAEAAGVPLDAVAEVARRFQATRIKREYAATAKAS